MRDYTSVPAEGEASPLTGVSFTLDGERFECLGELSALEMSELARQATGGGDMADAAMLALMAEPLAQAFGEEEYARFRAHCKAHHTPTSVYMQILSDLNEEIKAAVEAEARPPYEAAVALWAWGTGPGRADLTGYLPADRRRDGRPDAAAAGPQAEAARGHDHRREAAEAAAHGLTLGGFCDLAELALRRKMEWSDLLMLLSQVAEGLGADMDDYEIPAERLARFLRNDPATGRARDPEARRMEIAAFAEAMGGEVD